ncbi:tape measure protein [Holdemanella biformis]|uniref:tape measure protein n=1 Tax=Holdemanella biformis TaxID=1735 RepID=UPI001C27A5AE|nr:tape measure protein [Holdemanella biformis]MBU9894851.1 tape measure protein [Holdemanella biformis]MBV3415893.1 tape measure protein [Holdemanella biformis]
MASGENYKVNVTLSANDKNLSKTLSSVTKQSDSFLSKLKNSAVFGAFASVGASAMHTVTSAISGTISELSASNVAWKTFEGNMQMLGQSSGEINKTKKALQQYATQTIYSASDMSQTYSQLAAVGTKNCLQLVKGFGGLASAAENPQQAMKTLSQQGTQMAAKPMVAWQDFKLMLEQTPAGIAAVAREMGMSTSELVSAVQSGTVKTEDFFNAVEKAGNSKAFTKMATEYKSVGQAMDGLQETLANKLMPAYDKLSQIGIKALSAIIDGLDGFDANILTNGIDKVIDTFKRFGKAFESTDAIKAFKQALSDVGGAIKNVISQFKDTGLIEKFGQAFGQVVKFVSQAISAVSKFIGKLNGAQLSGIVGSVLGVVGGFKAFEAIKEINPFGIFKANAEEGLEGTVKTARKSKSKLAQVIRSVGLSVKDIGLGIKSAFQGIGQALSGTFKNLAQMLKVANPVNILALGGALFMVAAGIALIGESGNGLSSIAESLGKAFSEVIATTIDAVTQALIALAPVLPIICDAFAQLSPLVEAFGDAFGTVIESVGNAISNIVNAIGPVIENVVQIIANAIVQIVQALAPYIPAISEMVQATSEAIQAVCDAFIALVQNIQPIVESVKDLVQQLGDSISQVFESASDVITSFGDAVSGILDSLAGVIDSIGQSALNAGNGFKELAKGIQIITGLNLLDMAASLGAVATGVGAIATASSGIGDAGAQIMSLAIGLGLMVGYTESLSALAGVMPGVIASFSGIESIVGPLASASGAMTQFASSLIVITSATSVASSSLTALSNALMQVANQGGQAGTQLGTKFKTGLQNGLTQSVSVARSMSKNITSALKSASSGAYSVGQMIGNGLANGMASTLGRVSAIATRLAQEAEKATRAAAKVHSPSRVFMAIGNYIGKGFAIGIEQTERMVRKATESIVNIPSTQSLDGYGFRMDGVSNVNSTTYDFNSNQNFTFNSTLTLDGRTLAKASNRYTEEELNKSAKFKERLAGVV